VISLIFKKQKTKQNKSKYLELRKQTFW